MPRLTPLTVFLLAGCSAATAAPKLTEYDLAEYRAVVALSAASLDKPDTPSPKPPRKDCKVCNGTGKVRSGDGLLIFDCTACLPADPLARAEIPFGTTLASNTETRPLSCSCQTTALCECGDACPCAGPRIRTAWLYCTSPCAPCDRARAAIRDAAATGRLPADLRVVLKPAPDWVKAFPTFHWQVDGRWHQTHDPDTFLQNCTALRAPAVSSGHSSSIGSCESTCQSGGCGMPLYQIFTPVSFGLSGGFQAGGCASCGR
jgi:hypothetical protein